MEQMPKAVTKVYIALNGMVEANKKKAEQAAAIQAEGDRAQKLVSSLGKGGEFNEEAQSGVRGLGDVKLLGEAQSLYPKVIPASYTN
jgi:hypothetical protein